VVGESFEESLLDHVVERLVCHIGVDRLGAVSEQEAEVVHLAGFSRLDDESDAHPIAVADEVVMESCRGEEGRDGRVVAVEAAVGEDEDVRSVGDGAVGGGEEVVERLFEARSAVGDAEEHRQNGALEAFDGDVAEFFELLVFEDGHRKANLPTAGGFGMEEVPLGAERRVHRGDDFLADGVNGRIGHLSEELLEVVVEQLGLIGENREGGVVAHRADGPKGVARHRLEVDPQVLEGVSEDELAVEDRLVGEVRFRLRCAGDVVEVDEVGVEPFAIGVFRRDGMFQLLVADDASLFRVDEEHSSGLEAVFVEHAFGGNVEDADLRSHDDEVVFGDDVARGAQAVSVEDGSHANAVGKGDRGGTVPRLHQAGVVFVEGAFFGAHALVVFPRLGDHHHHRVGEGTPRKDEEFEAVVELRRVAPVFLDDVEEFGEVVAEEVGLEHRLSGAHPVFVAAEGVDFAVVNQIAIGMGARPAREGVRAEPRVEEDDGAFHRGVGEVEIVGGDLMGCEHPLVDDRSRGEARDVEVVASGGVGVADGVLDAPTDDVEAALERPVVGYVRRASDEYLADDRLAGEGGFSESLVVGGNRSPSDNGLSFFADDLLEPFFARLADSGVGREEDHADAVTAALRQSKPRLARHADEVFVGELEENAGAVAGVFFAPSGSPVVEADERLQRLAEQLVGGDAFDVDQEPNPTRVVFVTWVIETLSGRKSHGNAHPVSLPLGMRSVQKRGEAKIVHRVGTLTAVGVGAFVSGEFDGV